MVTASRPNSLTLLAGVGRRTAATELLSRTGTGRGLRGDLPGEGWSHQPVAEAGPSGHAADGAHPIVALQRGFVIPTWRRELRAMRVEPRGVRSCTHVLVHELPLAVACPSRLLS